MKAARIRNGEVTIQDVDPPIPAADQARVRVSASGVCRSDVHLVKGDWAGVHPDRIGHEAIGVVEELGPGAERFVAVGDRVMVGLGGWGGYWCGVCEHCLDGRPRHCPQAQEVIGTFAEQVAVHAPGLVALPNEVPDTEAPLACGGLTAYGAVKKLVRHGVTPGRWVAVVGAAGGLGHYAVQLSTAFGYRVLGIDLDRDRLAFAREMGAEIATTPEDAEQIAAARLGGVAATLVFTDRIAGFDLGLRLLGPRGLFVGVGMPPTSEGSFQIDPTQAFFRDPTIVFSGGGNVQDMRELVRLVAAGKVRTHVDRIGALSDLGAVLDELAARTYLGRAVITDLTA